MMGGGGGSFVSWEDLQVGSDVVIYGRPLSIIDCDTFTREFYNAKGRPQAPGIPVPKDPYMSKRRGGHDRATSKVRNS